MNRKSYLTDLSNTKWQVLEKYFLVSYIEGGRPPIYSKRELLNTVLYSISSLT